MMLSLQILTFVQPLPCMLHRSYVIFKIHIHIEIDGYMENKLSESVERWQVSKLDY